MADFDRTVEDIGNIVTMEHVNVRVPDQQLGITFYVTALGLTRDPYLMTGTTNMWINAGRSQFHLPTGAAQVLRGTTGLVIPGREALLQRLHAATDALTGSAFSFKERPDHIAVTCPWGNRIRCHPVSPEFGAMTIGMPYVVLDVPTGTAIAISDFYAKTLGAVTAVSALNNAPAARITVGADQKLFFRETERALPEFDGHHIQIYVSDFSRPHERLLEHNLITEESDAHQYRFEDILNLDTGEKVFTLEHEVRSLRHPLYARPLVNRNPAQMISTYIPGQDAL